MTWDVEKDDFVDPASEISEDELWDYVEGKLTVQRSIEISSRLLNDNALRDKLAEILKHHFVLLQSDESVLSEDVPDRFKQLIKQTRSEKM